MGNPVFDHLALLDRHTHRDLIKEACGDADIVYLAPLEKGLSGSSVWQVRWRSRNTERLSALQVLKIGNTKKLKREEDAVTRIAEPTDGITPQVRLFLHPTSVDEAVLRSRYIGSSEEGTPVSLCDYLRKTCNLTTCADAIDSLYQHRMEKWHYTTHPPKHSSEPLRKALDWWMRDNIKDCAERVGERGVSKLLLETYSLTLDELISKINALKDEVRRIVIGPVHGDLHSQNVVVSADGKMELIDFGWTAERWRAIDFLMLECSLKFLVAPMGAQICDLLWVDDAADRASSGENSLDEIASEVRGAIHGEQLIKIVACVVRIREHALASGAVADRILYREGLALLTAGLSSMPHTINLPFLLLSLGHQVRALQ